MNVLYIDHYAGSQSMGMEFRPYYLAREWKKQDIKTTILAANYAHLRKKNPEVKKNLEVQEIDGVDFMFIKTINYEGNGVKRIISMMEFVEKVRFFAKKIAEMVKPDVVIASSTYPLDTYCAQKICKYSKAMLIHEIHDLWPLSPKVYGGYSDNHPFIKIMQKAEIDAYSKADVIVSILPNTEPYIRSLGVTTPVVKVPNGLLNETINENHPGNDKVIKIIEDLKAKGDFVVGYAGGISVSNAMNDFIEAMKKIGNDKGVSAVIIGDGILRKDLEKIINDNGMTNTHFVGSIAKSEVKETLSHMDTLFMGAQKSILFQHGVSANKIFDYMMVGLPVIAAFDASQSPLQYAGVQIQAEDSNPDSIVDAIHRAMNLSQEEKERIKTVSQQYIRDHHNYDKLAYDFSDVFEMRNKSKYR